MVDPKNVLEAISPMLDSNGGIREVNHVHRIVGFMRDNATKLASRCVYLLIISATKNREILRKLVSSDGWVILSSWLDEAEADENFPLLMELLNVFSILPIDVKILQSTNAPKTINKMSKANDKRYVEVAKLCKSLVANWKNQVKGTASTNPAKPEVKREPDTAVKREADFRASYSSTNGSISKMDDDSADAVEEPPTATKIIAAPSMPQKPKLSTVKTHPIKFRQTGLEAPSAAAKRTNIQEDANALKKPKLSNGNVFDVLNAHMNGGTNGTVGVPAPTIPAIPVRKPPVVTKVVEYRESTGFMEALSANRISTVLPPATMQVISTTQAAQSAAAQTAATSPTTTVGSLIRRKKRPAPGVNILGADTANRPGASPPADASAERSPTAESPPASSSKSGKKRVWWPDDSALRQVKFYEVDHEPIMHGRQHGDDMKKAEMQLDRSAVLKARQYGEQQLLADQEDAAAEASSREYTGSSNRMSPGYSPGSSSPGTHAWKRLIPLDLPDNILDIHSNYGSKSTEKVAQFDHQLRVLEVVYFIRRDIPDSAAEPNPSDLFAETAIQTKAIPLEVMPEFSAEALAAAVSTMSPAYGTTTVPIATAPAAVTLPGPLSSVLAAISQPPVPPAPAVTATQAPAPMDSTPAQLPPPPMPPPPPFPFDPSMFPPMQLPPMPPGENGAMPPMPMPPWPPGGPPPPGMPPMPPGMPFPPFFPPFPPMPGMPPMPSDANGSTAVPPLPVPPPPPGMNLPPFPGGMPPFPPPVVAPVAPPSSNSPPTIMPVGSSSGPSSTTSSGALLPTPQNSQQQQQQQMQQQHQAEPQHHAQNAEVGRRPVTMRFAAGIPSRVPFGVCRYFYDSGTCPRMSYCRFKHIQRPMESSAAANSMAVDDQNGGDSPQNFVSSAMSAGPKLAPPITAGRR